MREILENHVPADWQVERLEDHATYAQIPASHRNLPRLAFARNPFSWHVSWFHYQRKHQSDFFLKISEGGRLGFADTMKNAYTGNGPLSGSSGALTQTLFDMLGRGLNGAKVGKMEQMREEMVRLFSECGPMPPETAHAIHALPPQNTSNHEHFSTYYDDELRSLVRDRDAPVFDFFGYEWEQPPRA